MFTYGLPMCIKVLVYRRKFNIILIWHGVLEGLVSYASGTLICCIFMGIL